MAKGPGSREVRKLQLTGGATYTLSLPKSWVELNNLESSSGVLIDWRQSGALRLTPSSGFHSPKRKITFVCEDLPPGSIFDHLVGAYLSGATTIDIRTREKLGRGLRRTIRRFLKSTRGFEISEEDDKRMILISLLSASELPLRASLNRMYQQLTSLMRDIDDVLHGGDIELIEDHEEREQEIDSMRLLIERQVAALLDSYKIAEALELGRREAVEFANLSRTLERMADHANQIAHLIESTKNFPQLDECEAPLENIPIWTESLRTLMINIREHDPGAISSARNNLKDAQSKLEIYEDELWRSHSKTVPLLFKFRLSESVRRMCAYSRDFGEILLNIISHAQLVEEKT
ncbi:MAG: phosphate uptake regulator PhoU [Euryarchaeota archaeon]|nr:phosphate uptake regulator PhoU [Euryarchaeota archaeon]